MAVGTLSYFANVGLDSLGWLIYFGIVSWGFLGLFGFFSLKCLLLHYIRRLTPASKETVCYLIKNACYFFFCGSLDDWLNLVVNNCNLLGIQVVWARIPKRSLCISLAALPLQCQGTESSALVDSKGNRLYGTGEGEAVCFGLLWFFFF